jgi:hypothetical protein
MTVTLRAPSIVGDRRKNTTAWAAYNRRRWRFEKDVVDLDERAPFVCECGSASCTAAVTLTMMEYESAHMCPSWRAVLPEHVMPDDATEVILRHDHFWVVEQGRL